MGSTTRQRVGKAGVVIAVFGAGAIIAGLCWNAWGAARAESAGQPKVQVKAVRGLRAAVSIAPLRGLVAPIIAAANGTEAAAGKDEVLSIIPPGQSEHGYEIPPSKLAALREVDVVVVVGLGLDAQVEKYLAENPAAAGRSRRIVRFADAAGLSEEEKAAGEHDHDHAHGHDEHHHHHAVDPHIWLDPVMVEKLVVAVTAAVAESVKDDSARTARVEKAGAAVQARVVAMHEAYASACGSFQNKTIVVGHDAWGRLASRYGLKTVAIADLNASEPTVKALERAAATIREKNLKVVFVEPQLGERAGKRIAEMTGASVRRLDPLGSGDWFKMMEENLAELKGALGPPPVVAPVEKSGKP